MRVGFAGTPNFAALALEALIVTGLEVPLILTQPDRPKGRGLQLLASPVKHFALGRGLDVAQPGTLKSGDVQASLRAIALDVLVVAAYGLILPPAVLAWPKHGCLNIHASKLPRWRGAAPIQRAIAAGDTTTGVTIMQMDAGLDTGPMIECLAVDIAPRETAGTLHDKLAAAGARAIIAVLIRLARDGALEGIPQPATGVTYANKIERADAVIDWSQAAATIDCQIRALDPAPGATTAVGAHAVKVWRAERVASNHDAPAGTVVALTKEGVDVVCGEGTVRLLELQPANGKRMSAVAFAAGHAIAPGVRLGVAPD